MIKSLIAKTYGTSVPLADEKDKIEKNGLNEEENKYLNNDSDRNYFNGDKKIIKNDNNYDSNEPFNDKDVDKFVRKNLTNKSIKNLEIKEADLLNKRPTERGIRKYRADPETNNKKLNGSDNGVVFTPDNAMNEDAIEIQIFDH